MLDSRLIAMYIVFVFVSKETLATEISATSDGILNVKKKVQVADDGIYSLRIKATANGEAVADVQSESCISVTGYVGTEAVSGWGYDTNYWHKGDLGGYDLKLSNHCNYEIDRYLGVWNVSGIQETWIGQWFKIPAQKSCSATVNDLKISKSFSGESSSVILPVAKYGNGNVTFDSNDLTVSGILNLGTSPSVTLKPSDSSFINSSGKWVSKYNQSDIPLNFKVKRDASSGEYNSVMTAILVCE